MVKLLFRGNFLLVNRSYREAIVGAVDPDVEGYNAVMDPFIRSATHEDYEDRL